MIQMRSKSLFIILVLLSCSSFAKTIYSKYQTSPEFAAFDKAMNQARLPSSDANRNNENIELLEGLIQKHSDYPEISAAHFFMGRCNYKMKNYRTAIENYEVALKINPALATLTPVNRFIATMKSKVSRQNNIILGLVFLCPWLLMVSVLFYKSIKRRLVGKKQIVGFFIGIVVASIVTIVWFSFNTSSSADGFKDLYVTPVFVRSTIFEIGSYPLVVLAICAFFTSVITAIATLASAVLPRFRFLFPLVTALVIGSSMSLLYYQYYGLDGDRTGTGIFKRISFPETPIDFHRDIPDEMVYLYDQKMQDLIRKAKAEAKASK